LRTTTPRYFFWNGTSAKETPGKLWWTTLKTIFRVAGIPDSHPHCLRDTFAVECLLGGIDIKDVSVMLGHFFLADHIKFNSTVRQPQCLERPSSPTIVHPDSLVLGRGTQLDATDVPRLDPGR
jgi:hypothetical protein